MLVELLSDSSYIKYNIRLANEIGLHEAIYINVILDVNLKAVKKDKVDESFFTLDRKYLKSVTTFEYEDQVVIERGLKDLGLIDISSSSTDNVTLKINMKFLTSLFMSDSTEIDTELSKNIKKVVSAKSKNTKTKSDFVIDSILKSLDINNGEFRDAFKEWSKSIVAKRGWINKEVAEIALTKLNAYSNRDLDIALGVLKIATANGWSEMEWAIKKYIDTKNSLVVPVVNTSAGCSVEGRKYI